MYLVYLQKELMQKLGKMEEEHQHLAESYSTLQRKWTELNGNILILNVQSCSLDYSLFISYLISMVIGSGTTMAVAIPTFNQIMCF